MNLCSLWVESIWPGELGKYMLFAFRCVLFQMIIVDNANALWRILYLPRYLDMHYQDTTGYRVDMNQARIGSGLRIFNSTQMIITTIWEKSLVLGIWRSVVFDQTVNNHRFSFLRKFRSIRYGCIESKLAVTVGTINKLLDHRGIHRITIVQKMCRRPNQFVYYSPIQTAEWVFPSIISRVRMFFDNNYYYRWCT